MKYYVYQLIDPRTRKPFYIGKGSGKRINRHEIEARQEAGISPHKENKIRQIWRSGLEVQKQIVRRFDDEQEAYQYENQLILSIGHNKLTNVGPTDRRPIKEPPEPGSLACRVQSALLIRCRPISYLIAMGRILKQHTRQEIDAALIEYRAWNKYHYGQ